MASSVTVQLENLRQLVADVQAIQEGGRKAISNTVKDVKARAPGWIAQEVTAVYNIKKGEIVPSSSGKPKKMAGTIRITGETIEELALTYKGRLLTPVHFGMTPKSPPAGKSYTLKAQILKGSKKVIGRYKNTRTKGGPILAAISLDPHGDGQHPSRRHELDPIPAHEHDPHRHQEDDHHLGAADDNQRPHQ